MKSLKFGLDTKYEIMIGIAVVAAVGCTVCYFMFQYFWWFTLITMASTLFAMSPFGWLEDEILIPLIALCWFVVVIHWLGAKCGCWSERFEGFEETSLDQSSSEPKED